MNDDVCTALHYAAANGKDTIVGQLIQAKANIQAVTSGGWTALHHAAWDGYNTIVGQLLQAKANIQAVDISGWTALHCTTPRGMGTTPLWDSCYKPKPIPRRWPGTGRRRFSSQSGTAIRTWCSDYGKSTAH